MTGFLIFSWKLNKTSVTLSLGEICNNWDLNCMKESRNPGIFQIWFIRTRYTPPIGYLCSRNYLWIDFMRSAAFLAIDHSARLLLPEEYASVILESHVCTTAQIDFPNRPYCIHAPLLEQRKEPNPMPPNSKPARLNQPNATVEHQWESKATLSYLTLSAAGWHSLPYQEILNEN